MDSNVMLEKLQQGVARLSADILRLSTLATHAVVSKKVSATRGDQDHDGAAC